MNPLEFNKACAEFFNLEYKEDDTYAPALLAKNEWQEWEEFDAYNDSNITSELRAALHISTIPMTTGYFCECLHPHANGVNISVQEDNIVVAENSCIWHALTTAGLMDTTVH